MPSRQSIRLDTGNDRVWVVTLRESDLPLIYRFVRAGENPREIMRIFDLSLEEFQSALVSIARGEAPTPVPKWKQLKNPK